MSMLSRHPWSHNFQRWLEASAIPHQTLIWERSGGRHQLLCLGSIIAEKNHSSAPVVFFLHGLGNDALFPNIALFRRLLAAGFTVVTSDLDGHGIGGASTLSLDTIGTLVEDVIHQIDGLTHFKSKVHLIGYSLGGVLHLDFAARHPERIQSLAMIGAPMHLHHKSRFLGELLTGVCPAFWSATANYGPGGIWPSVGPFGRGRYPVRLRSSQSGHYLDLGTRIIDMVKPLEKIPQITIPALYIYGGWDCLVKDLAIFDALKLRKIPTFMIKRETHFSSMLHPAMMERIEVWLRYGN